MSKDDEKVNHPAHYGGGMLDPYEHIKVVEAWGLNYELGNCTKYICRAGKKPGADALEDLRKAAFYLDYEIAKRATNVSVREAVAMSAPDVMRSEKSRG